MFITNFRYILNYILMTLVVMLLTGLSPAYANNPNLSDSLDTLINTIAYGECDTLISIKGGYSPQEVWAWNTRLCLGAEVDMSLYPTDKSRHKKNRCDISNYKKWPKTRELSTNLIFLIHKYSDKYKLTGGVGIKCAIFNEKINIYNIKDMAFAFDTTIFKHDINITGQLNNSNIIIFNSTFLRNINISSKLLSSLILTNTNIHGTLDLVGAVIESVLIVNSEIGDSLSAVNSHILSSVIIERTTFKNKQLNKNTKKSHLDFSSADIDGSLIIYSETDIEGDLSLSNSRIKKGLTIKSSTINGDIDLSNILIKDGLIINNSNIKANLSAQYSNILRYVDLSNSKFNSILFNSAKIEGRVVALNIQCNVLFNFNGTTIFGAFLVRGEDKEKAIINKINFDTLIIESNLEIVNVNIKDAIDASSILIKGSLSFISSLFNNKVKFDGADVKGNIKISNSTFKNDLSIQNSTINGFVDISDSNMTNFISNSSTFKKNFFANDVEITQELNINGAKVLRSIFIKGNGKGKIDTLKTNKKYTRNKINSINLAATEVGINVQIIDTDVSNNFEAGLMRVGGNFMLEDSNLSGLNFKNTKIDSNLYFTGSKFSGKIDAEGLSVASSAYLSNGVYEETVNLTRATINNYLNTKGSTFKKYLGLQQIHAGTIIFSIENIGSTSSFEMIDLFSSNIENNIFLAAATKVTQLDLRNTKIGSNLSLSLSNFTGGIYADSAEIGNNLFISGLITNKEVDLSNTKIGKALVMYSHSDYINKRTPVWKKGSKLLLRNTHVKSLVDHESSWMINKEKNKFIPTDLTNFSYENWGSSNKNGEIGIGQRSIKWLTKWIDSQIDKSNYNPQPYKNLANSLRNNGYEKKSEEVLIAMKEYQLATQGGVILRLQKLFINFGYNPIKALKWFFALFFLALFSLYIRPYLFKNKSVYIKKTFSKNCLYVLQVITPGIGFEERNNTWFDYIFRILGFIIISFLIAGLSGLIK